MAANQIGGGTAIRNCQHVNLDFDWQVSETGSHHTGELQIRNCRCPDCGQELAIMGPNGPVEYGYFPLMERSKASEELRKKLGLDPPRASKTAKKKPDPDPSLARSNIRRDGLKAGEAAPEFRLPSLDGAEVALADYRGRRLLLVFIHSDCKPCEQIAPDLQRLHDSGFPVLVINNKSVDDARRKVQKLGTTFPVAMQKEWEISKAYAMFATPIAYLVGPDGVIERDVSVGSDQVRALIVGATSASSVPPADASVPQ